MQMRSNTRAILRRWFAHMIVVRPIVLLLVLRCAAEAVCQVTVLDSLLISNRYIIERSDSGLSGTGIRFLLCETRDAQFVMIGENHNTKQIPKFTAALFALLNKHHGYQHLALEQDPIMMGLLADRQQRIDTLARAYPSGFTFITDEERAMVDQVRSISTATGPVWGCDQSFGAAHAIEVMRTVLRSHGTEVPALDSLYVIAQAKEKVRALDTYHFMSELGKRDQLLAIQASIPPAYRNALGWYMDQLLLSDSIYTLIKHRSYYEGRRIREEYMKHRFLEEYWKASEGGGLPKVLLKFGNYHLYDGFNPGSQVASLGGLVKQLAFMNGQQAIAINTLIYRNDGSDWDYFKKDPAVHYLQHFADHASVQQWTLFDLRPLRSYDYDGALEPWITPVERTNWEHLIHGYDMLLLIGNGTDGKASLTNGEY